MEKTAFEVGFEKAAGRIDSALSTLKHESGHIDPLKFVKKQTSDIAQKGVQAGSAAKKPMSGVTAAGGLGFGETRQAAKANLSHSTGDGKHMPLFKV